VINGDFFIVLSGIDRKSQVRLRWRSISPEITWKCGAAVHELFRCDDVLIARFYK
jgi:hypothetical protein